MVLSGALGACSTLRLGYGQAASFSYWWLDGYLDFSEAQTLRVREHLGAFFTWHSATQLPDYAALLHRARAEVVNDTSAARVCQWVGDVTLRLDASLQQMVPALTDVGRTLTPAQLERMSQKFAKVNAEFTDEFLQPDGASRHKASVRRAVDRAELLYGSLDRAQRELLSKGVANSPFDPELWLAQRKQRQQDILLALKQSASQDLPEATGTMATLVAQFQRPPRPVFAAYQQRLMPYNCALAAQLHNSMSASQRQAAAAKLKGWEDDFRALGSGR